MRTELPDALRIAIEQGHVQVVDVREEQEYKSGHVPTAINIPLSTFADHYQELSSQQEVHVICQTGVRSAQAVAFLEEKGYPAISVEGGTKAWRGKLVKETTD
ncbi:UNVERIFIED_CONTAM: rhodanese-like domain-containing protein [Streptococcus canis]|uniref:Rhodanese-like domain-containing protein n=1 Tax=Streptococcus canis TaxID=1329 RepID=A0AAE4Q7J8_STRCB|nr:rhodanese-like domain-containing protein [Streptococcus canis]MDV5976300.1 rhodanese-like domain-containing protein [Streptococcus canis]